MGTGSGPWDVLAGLPAWRITQLPRPPRPREDGVGDDGVARRAQELVSAYCRSAPVAVAWFREQAAGPVQVITAGRGLASGTDRDGDVLTFPAGARGQRLANGQAAGLLAAVPCWTALAGVCDVLLADKETPGLGLAGRDGARPSLEQGLLSAWPGPFAWLLVAEPADPDTLKELAKEAEHQQLSAKGFASPQAQIAAQRAAARHAELRQAASTGLWRVHLLAGAATAEDAGQVAGLLRASADLARLPYGLLPGEPAAAPLPRPDGRHAGRPSMIDDPALQWAVTAERQRHAAAASGEPSTRWSPGPQPAPREWGAPVQPAGQRWPDPEASAPFFGSTLLVAALARLPAREVPGLRMVLRPDFDLTPETATATTGRGISLAQVLDWNRVPCGDLMLSPESLNRHVFVCGATGSGKSQTIRALLEQATHAGIPWLVIEPAKAEYRLMAARLPGTQVIRIRPGALEQPPAGINPLEPAAGPGGKRFPLQTHADLLRALFLAAFQADEPFPQVLAAALTRCYEDAGWDLVTGRSVTTGVEPAYPGLEDLQIAALTVVDEIGYGREVRDNVRGFVTVRIGSLRLGTTGRFLDGGHPLDFTALLGSNVVFEIEDAGDDRDKAFLMGAVLIRLTEHLRLHHGPGISTGLKHLTVVEEAHRLLRQPPPGTGNGPAAQAVEMFADLLAEVRAYGEGLVIAEQIPAKLIPDVIKNTAVKIVHRLPAADDRAAVGATMNLQEDQSAYLVTLTPGDAAVFTDGMDYPVLARLPDGTARENSTDLPAASCEPVIGRRSSTCGQDCRTQPCTLVQMRAAQRAALTDPRITLWAELTVAGHLTGWIMPVPAGPFTAELRGMDTRLRDCALSHAVDAAVAARASVVSQAVSPGVMAAHVVAAMRQAIADGGWICDPAEPRYLAPASARQEKAATVMWGTRPDTAIERAVGIRATSPDWEQRLTAALGAFRELRWPLDYLQPAPPGQQAAT
jgi:hypothetical protein